MAHYIYRHGLPVLSEESTLVFPDTDKEIWVSDSSAYEVLYCSVCVSVSPLAENFMTQFFIIALAEIHFPFNSPNTQAKKRLLGLANVVCRESDNT
ncbi:hypothetical protein JHK82_014457 [Glycine max]|nr:hypothetical protein JHK82_014457 [Glycine max]